MNKMTEIAAYLFARNGQHIGRGTLESIKLDLKKFTLLMKPEIEFYQQYFPLRKKFNINVNPDKTYDFTSDPNNIGYDFSDHYNPVLGEPPIDITRATPVGQSQLINNWAQFNKGLGMPGQPGRLITPFQCLREYRKPKAWFSQPGRFDVTCYYEYSFKETYDNTVEPAVLTEVEIIGCDGHMYLLDLLSGRFLQLIGRSRRAFTYNDLQITTDADQLVKEGIEDYEKAKLTIQENQDYHNAYHR